MILTRVVDDTNSPACSRASPFVVRLDSKARQWLVGIAKASSNFGPTELGRSERRSAAPCGRTVPTDESVSSPELGLQEYRYHGR